MSAFCSINIIAAAKTRNRREILMENTITNQEVIFNNKRLFFGVDSNNSADTLLQNNLTLFEWVTRNKPNPDFWCRNIEGDNSLTKKEISYIRNIGCKIVPFYASDDEKITEEQGATIATKIVEAALNLGISNDTTIFLEIKDDEIVTTEYMRGYIKRMTFEGFDVGFKANTDAHYCFDREFSRGLQNENQTFKACAIWSTAPHLKEYDRITTSHFIHPDNWATFAPSGIKRDDVLIWQYGENCHPIESIEGKPVTFNVNLINKESFVTDKTI